MLSITTEVDVACFTSVGGAWGSGTRLLVPVGCEPISILHILPLRFRLP